MIEVWNPNLEDPQHECTCYGDRGCNCDCSLLYALTPDELEAIKREARASLLDECAEKIEPRGASKIYASELRERAKAERSAK